MSANEISLEKGTPVGRLRVGRRLILDEAGEYAIYGAPRGGKILVFSVEAADRISAFGGGSDASPLFDVETVTYKAILSQTGCELERLDRIRQPRNKGQALTFARALSEISDSGLDPSSSFYAEHLGSIICLADATSELVSKARILGRYLSNGADIEADDLVRLAKACTRLDLAELTEAASAAGLPLRECASPQHATPETGSSGLEVGKLERFALAGRPELEAFFNEHVIDVVNDLDRYRKLGIGFPGGILLYGPPGCGKTFAVEKLIDHLSWPFQSVDASSIASPYIHETSRKIAEVFRKAMETAPSVIMIDELDAFLSSRDVDSQTHRVEEVAEFLRRIPEAADNQVLLIGMTNRLEAIDAAILRRGRFDHLIEVGPASVEELEALLTELLKSISNSVSDVSSHARRLEGRPLSDVAHVVKNAARITAKERREAVTDDDLSRSIQANRPRREDRQRIGF